MMSKPRRPNYDRKLARSITLIDARRLVTLKDAADLLAKNFATVRAWSAPSNVDAATAQIEIVLRTRQLL